MLPVRLLQSTPNHLQQSSPTQEESLLEGSSSPSLNLRRALLCISMQPTVKFPALELDHIASSEINSVVSKRRKIRSTEQKGVFHVSHRCLAIYKVEGLNAIHNSFQIFFPFPLQGKYVTYLKYVWGTRNNVIKAIFKIFLIKNFHFAFQLLFDSFHIRSYIYIYIYIKRKLNQNLKL